MKKKFDRTLHLQSGRSIVLQLEPCTCHVPKKNTVPGTCAACGRAILTKEEKL